MILAKTNTGQIVKLEKDKYLDLQTNKPLDIDPNDVIETIEVGFKLWQVVKLFISLITKLFTK